MLTDLWPASRFVAGRHEIMDIQGEPSKKEAASGRRPVSSAVVRVRWRYQYSLTRQQYFIHQFFIQIAWTLLMGNCVYSMFVNSSDMLQWEPCKITAVGNQLLCLYFVAYVFSNVYVARGSPSLKFTRVEGRFELILCNHVLYHFVFHWSLLLFSLLS